VVEDSTIEDRTMEDRRADMETAQEEVHALNGSVEVITECTKVVEHSKALLKVNLLAMKLLVLLLCV
jgi:hypothetical protein